VPKLSKTQGDNFTPNQLPALALHLGHREELLDCHQRRGRTHTSMVLCYTRVDQ